MHLKDSDQPERRRLGFGEAIDRTVVYLIAGLVGWLCISNMTMREQVALLVERSMNDRTQIISIMQDQLKAHQTDVDHNERLTRLEEYRKLREEKGK